MINWRVKSILFLIIVFVSITKGIGQDTDSIRVFFWGSGNGEKFQFRDYNKKVLVVKVRGSYCYSFYISRPKFVTKEGDVVPINVARKAKYGLSFRSTELTIEYSDKKYLIIKRNHQLKDKFAVEYYWSDEAPPKRTNFGEIIFGKVVNP